MDIDSNIPTPEPVVLVCVPYAPLERPLMGISILKSALVRRGIGCRVVYAHLAFAEQIGVHPYDLVSRTNSNHLAGDWTFRAAAFPEVPPVDPAYFEHIDEGLRGFEHLLAKMGGPGSVRALIERVAAHAAEHVRTMARRVVASRPRIVGCGSTFQQQMAALALLREIKSIDPSIVTVLGGANCEAEMGVVTHRESPWIDYVVSGEADEVFPDLCDAVLRGSVDATEAGLPTGIIGPPHRAGGAAAYDRLMIRPPRAVLDDMDRSPSPDFDDYVDALAASPVGARIEPGLMIETSRGCWWGMVSHCTFCGLNGESMAYRSKSPPRVLAEIRSLTDRYRVPRLYAVDNILPMDYLKSVMPALVDASDGSHVFWETKANLKRQQLQRLADAGVRWIQPGLESFDDDILAKMGKGTTTRQNLQFLKWGRELGINCYWLFLYDFPGECDEAYADMARWIPLIAHLQPPRALAFVQYVRFSPYHRAPARYGISLSAEKAYGWVYPWPQGSIDSFCYYFDDYSIDRERIELHHDRPLRRAGLQALRAAFLDWTAQWPHSGLDGRESMAMLYMEDRDGQLIVVDTRRCRRADRHVLTGVARAVCLACHSAPPRHALPGRLATEFGLEVGAQELDDAVADLVDRGLLLPLGDTLIGLPLSERPRPLPSWAQHPGGRIISLTEHVIRSNLDALRDMAAMADCVLG